MKKNIKFVIPGIVLIISLTVLCSIQAKDDKPEQNQTLNVQQEQNDVNERSTEEKNDSEKTKKEKDEDVTETSEGLQETESVESDEEYKVENQYSDNAVIVVDPTSMAYNPNGPEYKMNEELVQDDWKYDVKSCEVVTKQGDWYYDAEAMDYRIDNDGKVLDDKVLLLVKYNVSLQGKKKKSQEFMMNSPLLLILDENRKLADDEDALLYAEASTSVDPERIKKRDSHYMSVDIKSGEIFETTNIYVVDKKLIKKNNIFLLSISRYTGPADGLQPSDHCYVRLEVDGIDNLEEDVKNVKTDKK